MISVVCGDGALLTGGFNSGDGEEWRWHMGAESSEPLTYQNWFDGQPNEDNRGYQVMLSIGVSSSRPWVDDNINYIMVTKPCFVCEIN